MVINHLISLRNLKEKFIRRKSVKENHSKKKSSLKSSQNELVVTLVICWKMGL